MEQSILSPIRLYDLNKYTVTGQTIFQCVTFMNGVNQIFFSVVSCSLISVYVQHRLDIHEKKKKK